MSSYNDTDERRFYLDTMVPYALLRAADPAALSLFRRIEQGEVVAYTSTLTFDELAYRLILALIRDAFDGSPLDRLRQDETGMLSRFAPVVSQQLHRLAALPNLHLVPVLPDDVDRMMDSLTRYHLRPRDGLHLAAMERVGCFALISQDAHFDRVPQLRRYTL